MALRRGLSYSGPRALWPKATRYITAEGLVYTYNSRQATSVYYRLHSLFHCVSIVTLNSDRPTTFHKHAHRHRPPSRMCSVTVITPSLIWKHLPEANLQLFPISADNLFPLQDTVVVYLTFVACIMIWTSSSMRAGDWRHAWLSRRSASRVDKTVRPLSRHCRPRRASNKQRRAPRVGVSVLT